MVANGEWTEKAKNTWGHVYSDGKALDITFEAETPRMKGYPILLNGFHGVLMEAASSGDKVAIEVEEREHRGTLPDGISSVDVGDLLYLGADNTLSASSGHAFARVTEASDEDGVFAFKLLPQART